MSIELPPLPADLVLFKVMLPPEKADVYFRVVRSIESRERILLARIAELEADAERYRWLREHSSLAWSRMGALAFAHYEKDSADKAALDAAIDAARKA